MKLIIPMAGMGKRMRPHTFATPKPLMLIAGKSIVQRILENLKNSTGKDISEVHFVIGNFGKEVEQNLLNIAAELGAKGYIHYQEQALGTAHAVFCAKEALNGEVCVAFADTLYYGDIVVNNNDEAIIWTYQVEDPSQYGVVVSDDDGVVTDFVEKPKDPVSNTAITGLYYFKNGQLLHDDIENLILTNKKTGGEYQLTDCLTRLKVQGVRFQNKILSEWLDFGNKTVFLESMKKAFILDQLNNYSKKNYPDTVFIEPVNIGDDVIINNSYIGPNVIIEHGSIIKSSELSDSIVGKKTEIGDSKVHDSLIGNFTKIHGFVGSVNLGDYNEIKEI